MRAGDLHGGKTSFFFPKHGGIGRCWPRGAQRQCHYERKEAREEGIPRRGHDGKQAARGSKQGPRWSTRQSVGDGRAWLRLDVAWPVGCVTWTSWAQLVVSCARRTQGLHGRCVLVLLRRRVRLPRSFVELRTVAAGLRRNGKQNGSPWLLQLAYKIVLERRYCYHFNKGSFVNIHMTYVYILI